jgi:AcrR family transcriptional regulator
MFNYLCGAFHVQNGWEGIISMKSAAKPRKAKPKEIPDDRSTRVRILATAEQEFAELGFDGASLRQIAIGAKVPVALVSYHFKGKLALYREVFRWRYPNIVEQRRTGLSLAQMEDDPDRRLEMIVKAVLVPMLKLRADESSRPSGILLARESADPKVADRGIVHEIFDPVAHETIDLLKQTISGKSETEIVWGYQMIIGTMLFIMGDTGRSSEMSHGACDPNDVDATIRNILPVLLNGLRGT